MEDFSEGLAYVGNKGKGYFIDKYGEKIFGLEALGGFKEGLIAVIDRNSKGTVPYPNVEKTTTYFQELKAANLYI